jgi:hypothetical protein
MTTRYTYNQPISTSKIRTDQLWIGDTEITPGNFLHDDLNSLTINDSINVPDGGLSFTKGTTLTTENGRFRAGTNTEMMKIQDGQLSVLGTQDSNSITTGSLLVNGGVGIAKNVFIGSSVVCGQNTNKGYFFGSDGANGLAYAGNTGAFFTNVATGDMILRNTGYGSIRIGTSTFSNFDILTNGNIVI